MDIQTLLHFYANQLYRRILGVLPSYDSLTNLSNSYLRSSRARSWRRKPGLPLPLPSNSLESSLVLTEASRIFDVLEDVLDRVFSNLHNIQKNLEFWKSRSEGTNAQKVYRMILERGPLAFLDGTFRLVRGCVTRGPHLQNLYRSSAAHIAERVAMLTYLRQCLATFLAQVYMEIDKYGEDLVRDPEKSLPTLLVDINSLFSELEESLTNTSPLHESGSSVRVDRSNTYLLQFEKLPEISEEGSQWTDCEIRDAINLIYQNLNKLDSYLSLVVTKYRKPRKTTLYWFRYTCGVVGLSVCSVWILRHSSLMGSSDIDNWIREGRESTVSFWKDHVEMPLLSIRDELFETFRKRHKGVMELEEVKLTADSLHRMLIAFSEQTRGQISPNASDQEMMEIVMGRYEKEMMHPIKNLVGGEIAHALLIQIQKLKLDVETAMLELDQILKANEINFAVLAALPAFFVSLIMIMGIRAWLKQDRGAEGRGRVARIQRRLLVVDVEKRIVQFQTCVNNGQEEDARFLFGLVLYSLDRLYRAVESHAKETGEWTSLRQDIIDLGKPKLQTEYKLILTSRLERVYDCLLPATNRR